MTSKLSHPKQMQPHMKQLPKYLTSRVATEAAPDVGTGKARGGICSIFEKAEAKGMDSGE